MLEFPKWKYAVMFLVLFASALYSLPNLYPKQPAVQISVTRGAIEEGLAARIDQRLKAEGIAGASVGPDGDGLIVRLPGTDAQTKAAEVLKQELGSRYTVALNLASSVPAWLSGLGGKPMTLGLDLQGGVHFLMEVDQKAALEKRENAYLDEIRGALRDAKFGDYDASRGVDGIAIRLKNPQDLLRAESLLMKGFPALQFSQPDSGNGLLLKAQATPAEAKRIADGAVDQNITILRNRIDALGVSEPVIQRQGGNRIIVQLPGVQDTAEAKDSIGATATLEYRAQIGDLGQAAEALSSGIVPPEARLYFMRETNPDGSRIPILLSRRVIVSGDQLVDATPISDPQTGRPAVSIKLDASGGKRMFNHTLENVGKNMAVVYVERVPETKIVGGQTVKTVRINEDVINSATIQGVFGKDFQTTGLDPQEAERLSKQLKAGALAAPMDFVQERVVGPSLGAENVKRGVQAVLYSFVFVMVFFVLYYRMFGLITNIALLLNLLLVVAVMSLFGATLTLPGFAGIALTVGMSVDANVLINERIREELRLGNTPLASIAAGYDKASGTIADANVTALLGGIAMAAFGSGPIRGFGITLIIGILTSMYTAVSVSRGVATLIYGGRRKLAKLSI
ncbi:protein translocase subunit SecD [Arenimonas maotaiensis]|uniref:Protein translocase subunit SecD n=1 Tax=Arenimonas maotaiensis TaxID=1446479 RepID=A0A917FJV8_9GAMM|nr:protein translocase subunit SecD [Arenimonas maotaiensis]GGF85245.1 protein translocase subunit SecD [Arenimonas maotaiensis]